MTFAGKYMVGTPIKSGSGRFNLLGCWLFGHRALELDRRSYQVDPPKVHGQTQGGPYRKADRVVGRGLIPQTFVLHWLSRIDLVHVRCTRCGEEREAQDGFSEKPPIRYTRYLEVVPHA